VAFIGIIYISKYGYSFHFSKDFVKIVVAGSIMGFFTYNLQHINVPLIIFLSIIIYVAALILTKCISKKEMVLIKKAMNKA
jgi:F0F1-type ATP synthase assembly protein I